jgi:murein DD-endopeptidase MepM/ murein hydrolase activator NlpD
MAFTVLPAPSGKHRRARRAPGRTRVTLAGVAVLTATGAFGSSAMAAPGQAEPEPADSTSLAQALDVTDSLVHSLAVQADAQHKAADTARAEAEQLRLQAAARAKAAADAKARAEARAKALREQQKQRAARAAARAALAYTRPVGAAPIGTEYHAAGSNWASGYHTGVDFLVDSGTAVHAVAAGTVVSAGWDGSYGNDVIIRHADGKYTLYGHLTEALVSAGQTVTEGQQIGISGATGNVTGPHLHFEVRTTPDYGSDIDPVAYLRSHGVGV